MQTHQQYILPAHSGLRHNVARPFFRVRSCYEFPQPRVIGAYALVLYLMTLMILFGITLFQGDLCCCLHFLSPLTTGFLARLSGDALGFPRESSATGETAWAWSNMLRRLTRPSRPSVPSDPSTGHLSSLCLSRMVRGHGGALRDFAAKPSDHYGRTLGSNLP